jgi:WD40 repeat protein
MTWRGDDSGNGALYLFSHVDLDGVPQFINYSGLASGPEVSDISRARHDAARALRELSPTPAVGHESDRDSFRQFSEHAARSFVPREGLVSWLTSFFADPNGGYGSIVGVAGIGKTTIMASVANAANPSHPPALPVSVLTGVIPPSMKSVHHFCQRALNWHRPEVALRLLNHQLGKAVGSPPELQPLSTTSPDRREVDRFQRYISAAGDRFQREGRQLCICIDAIDESRTDEAAALDLLRILPERLPAGVKCLVTFRIGDSGDPAVDRESWARFSRQQYRCLPFDIDEFALALSKHANASLNELPRMDIDALYRIAGGVPLLTTFLGEVLRRRGEDALAQFARTGNQQGVFWAWWASLPRERGFVHHRAVLVAATADRAVPETTLRAVLGVDPVAFEYVLEELGPVLVRSSQGVALFHDTLRVFALAAATPNELRECHARLAQAYSGGWKPGRVLQVNVAECRPDRACVHWLRAGEVKPAVLWLSSPFLVGLWIHHAGVVDIEPLIEELASKSVDAADATMLSLLRRTIEFRGDALQRAPFTVPQHMADVALASSDRALRHDLSAAWPRLEPEFPPILLMRDRPDATMQATLHLGPVSAFAHSGLDRFYTVGWDDKIREWSRLDKRCVRSRSAGLGGASLGGEFFCDLWQTETKDHLIAVPGLAGFESNGLAIVRLADLSVESRIACPNSYASAWDAQRNRLALRTTANELVVLDIRQQYFRSLAADVVAGPVFCSDGQRLVFASSVPGSALRRLSLIDTTRIEEIRVGSGEPARLLLRDNDHFVILDKDGTVRLCAFGPEPSDTVVARFPECYVAAISVATDSIALGGGNYNGPGLVVLLSAHTFVTRLSRSDLASPVQTLAFDESQRQLLVGHSDGSITILDLDQHVPDVRFGSRARADHAAAFSADGRTVVTAGGGVMEHLWFVATGETNSIRCLDAASNREHSRLTLPKGVAIEELATSSDTATVAVIADAGTRCFVAYNHDHDGLSSFVHEAVRCQCPICRPVPEWAGGSIKRQGRRRVGTLGAGQAPFLKFLPSGVLEVGPLAAASHALTLERVVVSPDGRWAVVGDLGGDLTVYSVGPETRTVRRFPGLHRLLQDAAAADPEARPVIDHAINLLASGMLPSTRPEVEEALRQTPASSLAPAFHQFFSGVSALAVTSDSLRIAVARYDGHVEMWRAPQLRLDKVLCRLVAPVSHLTVSQDARYLVAALMESDVVVLGLDPCREVAAIRQVSELAALSVSPDGQLVAQGGRYGDIAIADIASGTPLARHTLGAGITALQFKTDAEGQLQLLAADASRRVTTFNLHFNRDNEGRWSDGPLWRVFEHTRPQSRADHRLVALSEESLTVDAATRFVAFWSALPRAVKQSDMAAGLYEIFRDALAGSRLNRLAPTMEARHRAAAIGAAVAVRSHGPNDRESLEELRRLEHELCAELPLAERYAHLASVGRDAWPQLRVGQRIALSEWLAACCPPERPHERCGVLLALARLYLLEYGCAGKARDVLREAKGLLKTLGASELRDDYDLLTRELHSPVSRLMAFVSRLVNRRAE